MLPEYIIQLCSPISLNQSGDDLLANQIFTAFTDIQTISEAF
jgi:hypothetical protein